MTPRKLHALLRRRRADLRRQEMMLALLRCDIINAGFCRPKDPVKPRDLLGEETDDVAAPGAVPAPARPPTPMEIHHYVNRRRAAAGVPPLPETASGQNVRPGV